MREGSAKRKSRDFSKRRKYSKKEKIVVIRPGEVKFHDLDIDTAPIAAGGVISQDSCLLINQAVTESARIGRKINVTHVGWRFDLKLPATATATDTSDVVRLILYWDKQANGATAAVTDILETADYQSFNNLSNSGRFKTLMDKTYHMDSPAGSGRGSTDTLSYGEAETGGSFFKRLDIPVEYSAAAGAITELNSNNIGVLALTVAGKVSLLSKMRIRFTDG